MTQKFKAIFFDNDGILVDTERLFFYACRDLLKEWYDIDLSLEVYSLYGYVQGIGMTGFLSERGFEKSEIEKFRVERNHRYQQFLHEGKYAIDGVEEVLKVLHQKYKLAVVTASRRVDFEIIHAQTGFLPYFDFVIALEDVARSKPNPDPYLQALKISGFAPEECLVIEDSPRGIAAAKAAGLTCWAIPTVQTRLLDLSQSDKVLEKMSDTLKFL